MPGRGAGRYVSARSVRPPVMGGFVFLFPFFFIYHFFFAMGHWTLVQ